jgi:hypothetical protein
MVFFSTFATSTNRDMYFNGTRRFSKLTYSLVVPAQKTQTDVLKFETNLTQML